jgi:outer membrane protein assembly factor BamB
MHKKSTSTARIQWKASLGHIHSRNNILRVGASRLLVSSAGLRWNEPDPSDGVYCLDSQTGAILWFVHTNTDANEIAVAGDSVIIPTDGGSIFVVSLESGDVRHIHLVDDSVFGKPLVIEHFDDWTALVFSKCGTAWTFSSRSESVRRIGVVSGTIRATPVALSNGDLIVASEEGSILRCSFEKSCFEVRQIAALDYRGFDPGYPTRAFVPAKITATPLVSRGRVYLGFARETTYLELPLACVSAKGGLLWQTGRVLADDPWGGNEKENQNFGNIRTTPALIANKLIVAPAYSHSMYFVDPMTGRIDGEVRIGELVFQQWSSPVPVGPRHAAIGRIDGVLSIVDVLERNLVASISLATAESEKLSRTHDDRPYEFMNYSPDPGEAPVGGICGTPLVHGANVYVGTTSGQIAAISLNLSRS